MKKESIEPNRRVRDRTTYFTGFSIARTEYRDSPPRILISALTADGGLFQHWVNESLVDYIDVPEDTLDG